MSEQVYDFIDSINSDPSIMTYYPDIFPDIDPFNDLITDEDSKLSNNNIIKQNKFEVKIAVKRGRKYDTSFENNQKNKIKKIHTKSAFDNLQTKLQVHFINFIINFANDAISTEFNYNKEKIPGFFRQIN